MAEKIEKKNKPCLELSKMHPNDVILLKSLTSKEENLKDLAARLKMKYDAAMRSALTLRELGLASVKESMKDYPVLTAEGNRFLKEGFPEQRIVKKKEQKVEELDDEERKIGIPWALKNKWIKIVAGKVKVENAPESLEDYDIYKGLKALSEGKSVDEKMIKTLASRGNVAMKREKIFSVSATEEGLKIGKEFEGAGGEVNELTSEMIVSGGWREVRFRRYNVEAPV
ncbi:MAG: hypothetical protein QW112_02565, partial [Candidatus Micrarchaeia archaeon]